MSTPDRSGPDPDLPRHPIAVVSQRTGLSQDVLRAWERRYGVFEPARSDGGFRLYSDADEERAKAMHRLIDEGLSAAQAAAAVREG